MHGKEILDSVEILLRFDLIELMHDILLGKCQFDWFLFGESVDYDSMPSKK